MERACRQGVVSEPAASEDATGELAAPAHCGAGNLQLARGVDGGVEGERHPPVGGKFEVCLRG